MDFNGQKRWLDHAIDNRFDPATAAQTQKELNAYRRKRVLDALKTRPMLLPLEFNMNAAGQVSPYRDTTPRLDYDVLVTGVKSDNQTRDIIISNTATGSSLTRIGDESSLYLRADEIAGQIPGNGGQTGICYLTTPLLIQAGNRVTVEMFKTDTTADAEDANIVLIGVRVYPRMFGSAVADGDRELIDQAIRLREIPQPRFAKVTFDFDSAVQGGEARNINTPTFEEPILVRGVRTSLRYSLIEIGVRGEPTWTHEATPCWAIAGEDEGGHENYIWFSKPVYLAPHASIEIRRVVNGMYTDAALIDSETGNTMTFICETI